MEFIKNKFFLIGIVAGLLWTSVLAMMIISIRSPVPLDQIIIQLYQAQKLGGLIALSSLINIPIFLLALSKNKLHFAGGIVVACFLLFVFQFFS
ncbi:MAG: hypothetical protein OXC92_00100 [Flavobacteriaceae bacterium]|nr:hypothetical protein [Flavobacteriaceae bacterium]